MLFIVVRFNLPRAMQPTDANRGTENQSPALFTDRWLSKIEDKILALSAKSGKPQQSDLQTSVVSGNKYDQEMGEED